MKLPVAAAPGPPTATLFRRVVIAATLIAIGNIASRVLGLARESVIAGLFGAGAAVEVDGGHREPDPPCMIC